MTPRAELRVAVAGAGVVAVAFGMGRFAVGLTLPDLRSDPGLSPTGLSEIAVGLLASAAFAGYLAGILGAPLLARRRGPRAPTVLGGVCGALGGAVVVLAPGPVVLAVGAALVSSSAGWVWAPYSDLVAAVAAPARRPGLLATISTGTSAGLVVVGLVAAAGPGWRTVWGAIGLASAAAAVLNLRWSPHVPPADAVPRATGTATGTVTGDGRSRACLPPAVPSAYSAGYYVATSLFFTYIAEALRRAGLPPAAGPVLFAVIGVVGLSGLLAGRWCARLGPGRVGALCLGAVALALAVLGLAGGWWPAAVGAAVVFAPGYMAGAAVIAIWTSEIAPQDATATMTAVVAVGALSAVVGPPVVAALVGPLGLPPVLVGLALLTGVGGIVLARRRV